MNVSLLRRQLRRVNKSESGQTLVLVAVGLMMMLMMAGLGVDVGWLHYQKQQMQKAADSAALAAAEAYINGSNWQQAGWNDATVNGYHNTKNGVTVTVNHPPQTVGDPFQGNANYVEAIITQARPTFFMNVAGWHSANVRARSVATIAASASGCIVALDPTGKDGLVLNGNVTVSATCGVYVDSSDQKALEFNGGGTGGLTASTIGVVGNYTGNGSFTPTPTVGLNPPYADPLANLPAPTFNVSSCVTPLPTQTNFTAGCYKGGITLSGNTAYTFSGLVILYGGGLKATGTGTTITGTGVTIYNTGTQNGPNAYGSISINGGLSVSLSAPTSGTYAGILFFQDRNYTSTKNNDASSFGGGASETLTGALYFPGTDLTYAGNPNSVVSSLIVAYQIAINGNTSINDNLLINGGSPAQSAALAE